jgi:CHAT domain-containing protein
MLGIDHLLFAGEPFRGSYTSELLGARAHFEQQRGATRDAGRDLARALDEVDRQRAEAPSRIAFLDRAQALFRQAATLQLGQDHPMAAFGALDRSRARFLLDRWQATPLASLAPFPLGQDLCRRLPPATVALVYAELDEHLVTWLVQPTGIEVSTDRPAFGAVAQLARSVRPAMRNRSAAEALPTLETLYQLLVGPSASRIPRGDRIVFIPTDALWEVPFAALRDPISRRFLVQDHAVGLAPSLAALVASAALDRQAASRPLASALIVASPTLRGQDGWTLPSLPAAAREAALLADIYGSLDTRVLVTAAATPEQVLAALSHSDVAHFAVHGTFDPHSQTGPTLKLAPDGAGQGDLPSRSILQLRLPRTHLVFLAACDSQPGPLSASEGPLGLAHAFLAAGVPTVVASLWAVDDQSTARLSVRFHQDFRRGADALTALRAAQLAEIADGPRDWTWATFEVLGGTFPRGACPTATESQRAAHLPAPRRPAVRSTAARRRRFVVQRCGMEAAPRPSDSAAAAPKRGRPPFMPAPPARANWPDRH